MAEIKARYPRPFEMAPDRATLIGQAGIYDVYTHEPVFDDEDEDGNETIWLMLKGPIRSDQVGQMQERPRELELVQNAQGEWEIKHAYLGVGNSMPISAEDLTAVAMLNGHLGTVSLGDALERLEV